MGQEAYTTNLRVNVTGPIVIKTNIGLGTLEIPGNIETQWEKNKSTTATKNNGLNISKPRYKGKNFALLGNREIPPLGESDTIQLQQHLSSPFFLVSYF